MTSSNFTYSKPKVIQALRYHFISRKEIKILMIFVNVFAILSAGLFFFKQITPVAFLISSLLWFGLMIMFWFVLPNMIYKREKTFKDNFKASITEDGFGIENNRGSRDWRWKEFSEWMESPHFFHLYFNARSFFIIPKEAFAGDDVHAARKLIAANVKKS
ncbi:MAG: YcxB family protein [Chitinophagaceae bacterium]|nr:MAG: YcxB family protein [Chitinophagaceae bacterium]